MSGEQLAGGGSKSGPKPSELPEISFYERALAGLRRLPDTPPEEVTTVNDKEAAQITADAFGEKVAGVFKPQANSSATAEQDPGKPAPQEIKPEAQTSDQVSWWFTAKRPPSKAGAQEQQGWFTPRKKIEAPAQTPAPEQRREQTQDKSSAGNQLIERITAGIVIDQPATANHPVLLAPQRKDRYRTRPDEKRTEAHQRRLQTVTPRVFAEIPKEQRELTAPQTLLALPGEPTPDHTYDPLTSPYWRVLGNWRTQKGERSTSWMQRGLPPFDPLNAPLETLLGPTGNINDEPTPIGDAAQIATFTPYVPRHAKSDASPVEPTEVAVEPAPRAIEHAPGPQETTPEQPCSHLPEPVAPKVTVRSARLQVVKAPPLAPAIASEKVTYEKQPDDADEPTSLAPENTADKEAEFYPPVEIYRTHKLVPLDSSLLELKGTSETASPEQQQKTSVVARLPRVLQRGVVRLALSSVTGSEIPLVPIVAAEHPESTDRLVTVGRKVFSQTDTPEVVTVYASTDRIPGDSSTLNSLETVPPPPIPSFSSTSSTGFRNSQQPHYPQEEAATTQTQEKGPVEMPAARAFQLEQPFSPNPDELLAEEAAQNIAARKILLGKLATAFSRFKHRKETEASERSTVRPSRVATETQYTEPADPAITGSASARQSAEVFAFDVAEEHVEPETTLTVKLARKALFGAGLVAAAVFATRRRGRR